MKPPYHDNLSLHTVHRVTIFFQKQLDCWALKIIGYWLVFTRGQSLLINLCKSLWEIRNLVCLSQIPLEKEKSRTLNVGVIYPSIFSVFRIYLKFSCHYITKDLQLIEVILDDLSRTESIVSRPWQKILFFSSFSLDSQTFATYHGAVQNTEI